MTAYPPVTGPDPIAEPTLAALLQQLDQRLNGSICCTLVYGSCLRSGDIYDGLLDLYLICDNYRTAYRSRLLAGVNWLLPPNVFYARQAPAGNSNEKTLRSKVTVISLRDFERGCSTAWYESYIWGRFAQPTFILYARDEQIRNRIEKSLMEAADTLLQRTLPALPKQGHLETLWENSLNLSYATELRTEQAGRAQELVELSKQFYAELTQQLVALPIDLYKQNGQWLYRSRIVGPKRYLAKVSWLFRRGLGKLLSIARLVKALFTFEGGLDYIAWKLERHSGQEIVIPEKVRRAPLLYMWSFFWGLYRRGIFK